MVKVNTKEKILIIEDEQAICDMLGYALMKAGFSCDEAINIDIAKEKIERSPPSLILLDWMLPDVSGIDYIRQLRNAPGTRDIPIIMLTAKGEESDKISGLNAGADDYMSKPFSVNELIARIKTVLRRYEVGLNNTQIEISGLVLEPDTCRVSVHGQNIDISPTEFKLLHFFITHPERMYSRSQILDNVWGIRVCVEERTVDVHIRRLRKTLAPFGFERYIQTVRSFGYRFSKR